VRLGILVVLGVLGAIGGFDDSAGDRSA
jgi:hypothetical protein